MFAYKDVLDKKLNKTHREYYLTQGDSFSLIATPLDVDINLIQQIVFKFGLPKSFGSCEIEELYTQNYIKRESDFICMVSADVTKDWTPTCCNIDKETGLEIPYVYEIEIHFNDETIETVEQYNFKVLKQIGG